MNRFRSFEKKKAYYGFLVLLCAVFFLFLTYIRSRENETFFASSTEAGYVEDDREDQGNIVLAEGMEQIYLYPGTYELTIDARTQEDSITFQVVDRWSNTLLTEHVYTPGEEYHTVRFSTDRIYEDVVVRSVMPETDQCMGIVNKEDNRILNIYGYTMTSDGYVCCDTFWGMLLLVLLLALLFLGVDRLLSRRQPAALFLTLLSACVSLPFLCNYMPEGHDIRFHMARICSLGIAIQERQIPRRLTSVLGGSSIIPIMYPESLLFGPACMVATGASVFFAYKATCVFITFLSAYLSYYAVRAVASEQTACLFTFLYLLNPYRLNELFVRAAIGEAFGMAFLPLVAVGMWLVTHDEERKGGVLIFLGFSGLLNSHVILTVVSFFFCTVYLFLILMVHPLRFMKKWKCLLPCIGAGLAAAVANAWFLIPFCSFLGWKLELSSGDYPEWIQSTAPYLWQIFMGETGYGMNNMDSSAKDEMPISIGPMLLIVLLSFLFLGFSDVANKKREENIACLNEKETSCGKWCLIVGVISLYLSSSYFPWSYVNEKCSLWSGTMGRIQYSWRLLTYASLMLSFLATILVRALLRKNTPPAVVFGGGLILLALLSGERAATEYYKNPVFMYSRYENAIITNYDYILESSWNGNKQEIKKWIESGEGPKIADKNSDVRITTYSRNGINYKFLYVNQGKNDAWVTVPVFCYDLHKAYLVANGVETELLTRMNVANQFTDISLPPDSYGEVQLRFEEPLIYRIGELVSLIAIIGIITWSIRTRWIKNVGKKQSAANDCSL